MELLTPCIHVITFGFVSQFPAEFVIFPCCQSSIIFSNSHLNMIKRHIINHNIDLMHGDYYNNKYNNN